MKLQNSFLISVFSAASLILLASSFKAVPAEAPANVASSTDDDIRAMLRDYIDYDKLGRANDGDAPWSYAREMKTVPTATSRVGE